MGGMAKIRPGMCASPDIRPAAALNRRSGRRRPAATTALTPLRRCYRQRRNAFYVRVLPETSTMMLNLFIGFHARCRQINIVGRRFRDQWPRSGNQRFHCGGQSSSSRVRLPSAFFTTAFGTAWYAVAGRRRSSHSTSVSLIIGSKARAAACLRTNRCVFRPSALITPANGDITCAYHLPPRRARQGRQRKETVGINAVFHARMLG